MSYLIVGLHRLIRSPDGRLDGMLRNCLHDLCDNSPVDTDSTDSNTQPATDMAVVPPAFVAVWVAGTRSIDDPHGPTAASTPDQPGEKRATTTGRLAIGPLVHVSILQDQL